MTPLRHVLLVFLGAILALRQIVAVSLVEISVDVDGQSFPFTWRPGSEDVVLKVENFLEEHSLDPLLRFSILNDIKVRRAWLVANSTASPTLKVPSIPLKRGQLTKEVKSEEQTILALHMGHDSSIAITRNGRVQCILELERLFEVRYFAPPVKDWTKFRKDWTHALKTVQRRCVCEDGWIPSHFTDAVLLFPGFAQEQFILIHLAEKVFSIDRWHYCDHHQAHALAAYYSSPFRSALVVSYDSTGNDGTFNVYLGSFDKMQRIAQLDYSLGSAYEQLATLLPEVTGSPLEAFFDCDQINVTEVSEVGEMVGPHTLYFTTHSSLPWAGKLMGYAAIAEPIEDLRPLVRFYLEVSGSPGHGNYPAPLLRAACESVEGQRALGATIQLEFENFVEERVKALLEHVGHQEVEGIALTGGCALNVLANQRIYDLVTNGSSGSAGSVLDVYVPPAPNDSGLSLGATWSVAPPKVRQPLQYLGFPLWDEGRLLRYARNRGAKRLSSLGGVEYLADLLAGGDPWLRQRNSSAEKPIVAVVRGRQEFGPRALGHRSLLAVPDSHQMRERMNRLKARQWYRPVAPMIAEEALGQVFGRHVSSPFMTMAPQVLPETRRSFPALSHLDGTARHQSVARTEEPWIHALLMAVGKRTGLAALINTSFNTKGKPIVNKISECLSMLDDLPDLDFVVIEDWIFRKRNVGGQRPW
ncbi:unnamed protein product [Cladocopium goreaui]|uniref:Nodulation protein NolNO n=1 Tax=Cladocopium goreaui TaxID=2562237 RepID=A0A9P1FVZ5_9DINO|nr:unnamed protein product [Cladocopium goreaui]